MDIDGSRLWGYLLALAAVFALHGLFAVTAAAAEKLRPKVKSLAEKDRAYEKLAKQLEKPQRLNVTFLTERALHAALTALLLGQLGWCGLLPVLRVMCGLDLFWAKLLTAAAVILAAGLVTALGNTLFARIGAQKVERLLPKNSRLIGMLVILLMPLQSLVRGIDWILGGSAYNEEDAVTEEEFLLMVDAGNETGLIEESQKEMINNIIDFDDVMISNVMTHRKEIVAVDVDMKISDVVYLAMNESYSRMPVYQGSIDHIIGVLMVKDLLGLIGAEDVSCFGVRHFMRQALFVPETAKCKNVLEDMLRDKAQMAVAVDEYGGTAGIVTMEDLLEEIVGNIRDEYDDEEIEIREMTEGVFTIEGTADPEETMEQLGLTLSEEHDFDTMSAWVVELLGRIPDEDETPSVQYENVRFTVLLMEDNWISKIKAEIIS
ncbi:MAG: HlyC/CorC family transporter [Ruminococcus sp.]|nr:HlyC/CorC family transporter [Ruminococcus sp.]